MTNTKTNEEGKDIEAGNVLIDIFYRGSELFGDGEWVGKLRGSENHQNYFDTIPVDNLQYYTSWDWLMPVYDYFRCIVVDGNIFNQRQAHVQLIYQEIIRVNIRGAHDRLVEAITWYNDQNQK